MSFWHTIKLCFLIGSALCLSSCSSSSKPTLHLFTWSDLFKPELIDQFEEKFNCRVTIDTYDSNESMYAKLKLSSVNYDIIFPSSYYIDILKNQQMIQPLDPAKIANLSHLDTKYFQMTSSPSAVPFIISFSGIAYRQDKVQIDHPSWDIFARHDLKGRMTMLNDAREALGAALKFLGYSINTRNAEQVAEAGDVLLSWKKNLAKFESEQYKNGLASGEFLVVQGYSIDIVQVREDNPHVSFIYPKEGAIMSIDSIAIPAKAAHVDLAHEFINFMLEAENAAINMAYTNSLVPVAPAYQLLSAEKQKDPILFPSQEALEKMEMLEDLQTDVQPYYKAWDKVKAG